MGERRQRLRMSGLHNRIIFPAKNSIILKGFFIQKKSMNLFILKLQTVQTKTKSKYSSSSFPHTPLASFTGVYSSPSGVQCSTYLSMPFYTEIHLSHCPPIPCQVVYPKLKQHISIQRITYIHTKNYTQICNTFLINNSQ